MHGNLAGPPVPGQMPALQHIVTGYIDIPEYLCASFLKVGFQYCLTKRRRKLIPMVGAKNMIRRSACAAMGCKTFAG